MRVCFIGDAGHVNLLSWAERFTKELGYDVHIITFNQPCEPLNGVTVHVINTPLAKTKWRYLLAVPKIKAAVGQIGPDLLIAYRISSYGLMAAMTGFRPLVVVAQGSDIFAKRHALIRSLYYRLIARRADLVQTWESHMRKRLLELGVPAERLLAFPKGINTDIFVPLDARPPRRRITLISTRQLRKSYNHALILEALSRLISVVPDVHYVICGDGDYRTQLEGLTRRYRIEHAVTFLGSVPHNSLPQHLQQADIYVSIQPSDGVSSSLLEAMACGVFPIVPDIEANRLWITHRDTGFLVPANDACCLAEAIIEAARNKRLRKAAANKNVAIVRERASMAANMERMHALYEDIVRRGPGRST